MIPKSMPLGKFARPEGGNRFSDETVRKESEPS